MTPSMGVGCVIAVLGAESTGKTDLAAALAGRLNARGIRATLVAEYLREWCERESRVPQPREQAAIAGEQTRRIAEAARHGVVVADTTAVMTAVYSEILFGDATLTADALAAQRGYAITLLTALDLPWVADGMQRDGPHVREPVDAMVRTALAHGGVPFAVVHGSGRERLANAWNALNLAAQAEAWVSSGSPGAGAEIGSLPADAQGAWRWSCDRCSDAACEHSMFRRLVGSEGDA